MSDFQQIVNLKEKIGQQIYSRKLKEKTRKELQKIDRPVENKIKLNFTLIRLVVFILAFLIVGLVTYNFFFKHSAANKEEAKNENWYAVKLVNNTTFYGQIKDIKADPIVTSNVYYNYDQEKDSQKQTNETNNLRLVKRGKETHGPAGVMDIVRSQVLFMEPLKADSKVLQAILANEGN
ncbi:MAG: hypothetical protein AAB653_00190 [Patescibacteria group bacterium]